VGNFDTREQRQKIYDYYAESLRQMGADLEGHAENCSAAPLCIGGEAGEILDMLFRVSPGAAWLYTCVAVRELRSAAAREKALTGRLEAQRSLTADAVRSAAEMESERDELLYRIGRLEDQLGTDSLSRMRRD
jgi:hypothetical protein